MLTAEGCRARRLRLWESLDEEPDWILVTDPASLVWLASFYPSPFVFRSVNAGAALILGRDRSATLVADNFLEAFAEQASVDAAVLPTWYRGKETAGHRRALLVQSVLALMEERPGSVLGIEASSVPTGLVEVLRQERRNLRLIDVDPVVHRLRRSKDPDEVAVLRRSMVAAEAAHAAALRHLRPGMTELEAFLLVQDAANRAAGEQAWIYGDFVSGPRTEKGGGPPTQRAIERGDLVLLDFSVVIDGYRGDFANTFACGGSPTDRQRALCDACLEAMRVGEQMLRPGAEGRVIDRAVRASFEQSGLGGTFPHHTGHGLGLGHPEPPYLVPESSDTLAAGDVVTIEPGQLVPGVGGMRYERNYLITEDGYELLSRHALSIDGMPTSA